MIRTRPCVCRKPTAGAGQPPLAKLMDEIGHVVESDLLAGSSDDDAPSRLVLRVEVVDLERQNTLGRSLTLATAFTRNTIVSPAMA